MIFQSLVIWDDTFISYFCLYSIQLIIYPLYMFIILYIKFPFSREYCGITIVLCEMLNHVNMLMQHMIILDNLLYDDINIRQLIILMACLSYLCRHESSDWRVVYQSVSRRLLYNCCFRYT